MNAQTDTLPACDVLVIGCGISGLSAAVSARAAGARVLVLERAVKEKFGGNTRWTESYFRMKNEHEVSDDFEERLIANAGYNLDPHIIGEVGADYENWPSYVRAHGMTDPELVSTLAQQAGPTVQWLKTFGIRFSNMPTYFLTAAAPRMMPAGGGLAMIEALRAHAEKIGVHISYQTTANAMRREDDGFAVDVVCEAGRRQAIRTRNVVIASGGFEGNAEMLTRYLGSSARYVRPVAPGGYFNRGEGIRMALENGAAPAGDFGSYHAEPLDPRSTAAEALVMNFPYGILVNKRGKRFTDEAPGPVDIHYDHISRDIGDQPEGIAYVLFDRKMDDVPNWKKSIRTDQPPLQAATLEELAALCGIDAAPLLRTVNEYNAACGKAGGKFSALDVDGLAAEGLDIRKSNWARAIDQGPFFAYPIVPGICFTYGGIKTNKSAQVVDQDGRAIPGLYAAGEAAGLYHQVYTGATSVMRGAVFGRIAGEHAAARQR
ncbi:FAD-dependent tricarballylate dehydrogenase TcuA [Herbaspirillum chlorophenolicum]|uniref:FAD-dependent tricarballylate dehydrogenase TcuA n=1 Tax=Herbaspirillum chlorophenolicum TaxID=211589 RepID=UPI00067B5F9B|nr:FAD-dependent tricarballylate dehydrogenase TcuA [Herbaspirillum chlorophenolicum]